MNERLPVEISRLAAQHIRDLETWWRVNRTSVPNAVREELQRVLRLITVTPLIGRRAEDVELPGVRRIHVKRIWHYLYYRVLTNPQRIELLALWSSSRGAPPPI